MSVNKTKLQILLIEDRIEDADLVRIYLKHAGLKHQLHHADSLYEGFQLVEELEDVDVVLLDLSLPDSHGFKTLTKFRERYTHLPIVVLTGLDDDTVGNQAIKAGAQDYLVKGKFESDLLVRVIRYSMQRFKAQISLEQYAQKLAHSERRILEAQEMAHFGNWEMDVVNNQMKWSDEVYRIFGHQPGSIQPSLSDYMGYVHPEDRQRVENAFGEVMKNAQLQRIQYRIVIGGAQIKYLVNQLKVQYDEDTQNILLVGALQDVTEHIESQQLRAEKNLLDKNAQKREEMLADMSFNIRTPLSSVLNLSYLLENTALSRQQREYIVNLQEAITDLSTSVNNLLNFSVLSADNVQVEVVEFEVTDLIQRVFQAAKLKADQADVTLKQVIPDALQERRLQGDINKLNQVLYNLVMASLEDSEAGSSVTIEVNLSGKGEASEVTFTVKNTAKGIPTLKQDFLYASEDRLAMMLNAHDQDRTLIGYAIVNKLVRTMGGHIDVSAQLKGNRFSIALPLPIIDPASLALEAAPSQPLRILLVEDNFLNQLATRKVLSTWSDLVTVDIASNGLIGVEKVRAHTYDLILMDLQMPVMNGYDASAKIRETHTTPIVALSAGWSHQEAERMRRSGINDSLAKPFKPEQLYEKIMLALHRHQA